MGGEVGKRAAEEFKKAGWNPAETATVSAWKQDVTVCTDRVNASKKEFAANAGAAVKNIDVATDNSRPAPRTRSRPRSPPTPR